MLLLFCALDAIVYRHLESFRLLGRKRSGARGAGGGVLVLVLSVWLSIVG